MVTGSEICDIIFRNYLKINCPDLFKCDIRLGLLLRFVLLEKILNQYKLYNIILLRKNYRNNEHATRGCSKYHCHCSSSPKLVRKTRRFLFFETGCSYSVDSMGSGYLMGYPDRCTVRRVDCKWHIVQENNENLPCQMTQAEQAAVTTVEFN